MVKETNSNRLNFNNINYFIHKNKYYNINKLHNFKIH